MLLNGSLCNTQYVWQKPFDNLKKKKKDFIHHFAIFFVAARFCIPTSPWTIRNNAFSLKPVLSQFISNSIFVQPICGDNNQLNQVSYTFLIFVWVTTGSLDSYSYKALQSQMMKLGVQQNSYLQFFLNGIFVEIQTKAKWRSLGIFPDANLPLPGYIPYRWQIHVWFSVTKNASHSVERKEQRSIDALFASLLLFKRCQEAPPSKQPKWKHRWWIVDAIILTCKYFILLNHTNRNWILRCVELIYKWDTEYSEGKKKEKANWPVFQWHQ